MRTFFGAAIFALLMPTVRAPAANAQESRFITPQMRAEDSRLDQRIHLTEARAYTGELLESLAASSGVAISAGDRDGSGDVIVAAYLRDAPLGNVMNAICSLVSYKGAEWQWTRTGESGAYAYRLVRPLAARQFAARFRQSVQEAFEDEAAAYRAALQLSPDELRRQADKDPRLKYLLDSPRGRKGLQTFFETVSRDVQTQVLRGAVRPRVPVAQLSPAGQEFVRSVWKANPVSIRRADGSNAPAPGPSWIDFDAHRFSTTVAPSLFIHLDGTGFAYIGGAPLERATCRRLADLWLTPDDHVSDKSEATHIAPPKSGALEPRDDNPLRLRLSQVADGVPVTIIARLPAKRRDVTDIGEQLWQSLAAVLDKLRKSDPQYMIKWRDGVLLIDTPTWVHEENRAPWSIVRSVRKEHGDRLGPFTLDELVHIAAKLTPEELHNLADEYPVMNGVAPWHDLFAAMDASPLLNSQLRSDRGAPLAAVLPYLQSALRSGARSLESAPRGTTVTVEQAARQGMGIIQISVRGPDGKYIFGTGFVNSGHTPRR